MTGDRTDEARLARVVAKRSADRADGLAQRAVGDDDVVPHAVEDVPAMHRFTSAFYEKNEQIEVARDEGPLVAAVDEHPAPRREDEIAEAITRQPRCYSGEGRESPLGVSSLVNCPGITLFMSSGFYDSLIVAATLVTLALMLVGAAHLPFVRARVLIEQSARFT